MKPFDVPELLAHIIGYLWEDRKSLGACVLVSSTFSAMSSGYLHHSVSLPVNGDTLYDKLSSWQSHWQALLPRFRQAVVAGCSTWQGECLTYNTLDFVFRHLVGLTHLSIHDCKWEPSVVWREVSHRCRGLRQLTLDNVSMSALSVDLVCILAACPSLTELALLSVVWSDGREHDGSFGTISRCHLQSLHVAPVAATDLWRLGRIFASARSTLKKVHFSLDQDVYMGAQCFHRLLLLINLCLRCRRQCYGRRPCSYA